MTVDTDPDRRRVMQMSLLTAGLTLLSTGAARSAQTSMTSDPPRDFDLFYGSWHVKHRRLKERLAGNNEWIDFDGTSEMQPVLGGFGNMDDNVFNFPPGALRGVSLRVFDPAKKNWAIWWIDTRDPTKIDVPVVGTFKDGVGTFLADDTFKDRPIKVRLVWSRITRTSREWEQAFSPDGGKTWETNWTSSFTRVR